MSLSLSLLSVSVFQTFSNFFNFFLKAFSVRFSCLFSPLSVFQSSVFLTFSGRGSHGFSGSRRLARHKLLFYPVKKFTVLSFSYYSFTVLVKAKPHKASFTNVSKQCSETVQKLLLVRPWHRLTTPAVTHTRRPHEVEYWMSVGGHSRGTQRRKIRPSQRSDSSEHVTCQRLQPHPTKAPARGPPPHTSTLHSSSQHNAATPRRRGGGQRKLAPLSPLLSLEICQRCAAMQTHC